MGPVEARGFDGEFHLPVCRPSRVAFDAGRGRGEHHDTSDPGPFRQVDDLFGGAAGGEQIQAVDVVERRPEVVDPLQVATDDLDARGQTRRLRVPRQRPHVHAGPGELVDQLTPHYAGRTGHENSH